MGVKNPVPKWFGQEDNDPVKSSINATVKRDKKVVSEGIAKTDYLTGNFAVDAQTRMELQEMLSKKGDATIFNARAMYNKAISGTDPKFNARLAIQHQYDTLLDQPGQAQTRSTSLLDAYRGK